MTGLDLVKAQLCELCWAQSSKAITSSSDKYKSAFIAANVPSVSACSWRITAALLNEECKNRYLSILSQELFMILAKGQLISKGLFGVFNSLKNGRKKNRPN